MKNYILFILFSISLLSLVSVTYAQSNSNLYVSAENTLFEFSVNVVNQGKTITLAGSQPDTEIMVTLST